MAHIFGCSRGDTGLIFWGSRWRNPTPPVITVRVFMCLTTGDEQVTPGGIQRRSHRHYHYGHGAGVETTARCDVVRIAAFDSGRTELCAQFRLHRHLLA